MSYRIKNFKYRIGPLLSTEKRAELFIYAFYDPYWERSCRRANGSFSVRVNTTGEDATFLFLGKSAIKVFVTNRIW